MTICADRRQGCSGAVGKTSTKPTTCSPGRRRCFYLALDFFDASAFISAFNAQDPSADFNADGMYDFFDVSAFLTAFNDGCP